MVVLSALVGFCISACVFVPLRLRSERESDRRISDLEDRIQTLEMAVAEARRSLQTPVMVPPQDHVEHDWTDMVDGYGRKMYRACEGCLAREEYPQWPTN